MVIRETFYCSAIFSAGHQVNHYIQKKYDNQILANIGKAMVAVTAATLSQPFDVITRYIQMSYLKG
jgi:hypothetical protein